MWINFKNFSHYSIGKSISKPEAIIQRCVDLGLTAFTLTDHNLNGYIPLLKAKKKNPAAKDLKINVGMQWGRQTLIAKNLDGYKSLIKIYSNTYKDIREVSFDNLILINDFALEFFLDNFNQALLSTSYEECKKLVKPGWDERIKGCLGGKYVKNIYFGIQLVDKTTNPINEVISKGLRWLDKNGCVAIAESCYPAQYQSKDQWIGLCSKMKTTIGKVKKELEKPEYIEYEKYFRSNQYFIRSEEELEGHTQIELDNSIKIQEQIEDFDPFSGPIIPKFPSEKNSDELLKEICREGWKERIAKKIPKDKHKEYADRIKHELEVLQGAGLSDYFLILADIAKFARESGYWAGPARGSAAGCLTAYLSGITSIDPIPYGLIFERFYNAGRNTKDRVSFPDIDFDIEGRYKEKIFEYVKSKYGKEKVANIGTFGRMMARGIITEVLKIHEAGSEKDIKVISKIFPDESAIADDLNEMKEEEGESSIIQWTLENQPNQLRDYCYLDNEGKYQGKFAKYFEQAVRLEGLIKSESTHAAGLIIWPEELNNNFPTRLDKEGKTVIAYGMNEIESVGGVKMDILAIWIVDKMHAAQDLINSTRVEEL